MTALKKKFLLAIDPSLRSTGWVLFAADSGEPGCGGIIVPPGSKIPLAHRLDFLQEQVEALLARLELGPGDILICEGPAPLVHNPISALKVERVRGIFESVARMRGVSVPGRVNPRTVQTELLGMRGKQLAREEVKAWARETAARLYGERLEKLNLNPDGTPSVKPISQDIVDALLIGTLAISRIKICLQTGSELSTAFLPRGRSSSWGQKSGRGGWTEAEFKKLQTRH